MLVDKHYIDKTYNYLNCHNDLCSKICGLSKLHKYNHPLRPIISNVSSPNYNMESYIAKVLGLLNLTSNRLVKISLHLS